MVVTLVVLEELKSTLVAEILFVLEGLVALEGFSLMANIGKKIRRIFLVALKGLVALEGSGRGGVCLYTHCLKISVL